MGWRQSSPVQQALFRHGVSIFRFDISWRLDAHGKCGYELSCKYAHPLCLPLCCVPICPPIRTWEQIKFGVVGNFVPGSSWAPAVYLGYDTRNVLTIVDPTDPLGGLVPVTVIGGGIMTGHDLPGPPGRPNSEVFGKTDYDLFYGAVEDEADYTIELIVDMDMGIVDVYKGEKGCPPASMKSIWGFQLENVTATGRTAVRMENVIGVSVDGDGPDSAIDPNNPEEFDYIRLDNIRFEHYREFDVRSCGDVNNDEQVSVVDAVIVAQLSAGLSPATAVYKFLGDVDRSGDFANPGLTVSDALIIAQRAAGLAPLMLCPRCHGVGYPGCP
jgi:hypothetical protein